MWLLTSHLPTSPWLSRLRGTTRLSVSGVGVHVYFVPFEECLFVAGHPCLSPLKEASHIPPHDF